MKQNDDNASPPSVPAQTKKINPAVLIIVSAIFVTVPLCLFALVYFWLTQSAFNSVNELKAEELDEIKIQMLNLRRGPQNRPDPLGEETLRADENTPNYTDPDIDPTTLIRPDFDAFLGTLRGAEKVDRSAVPATAYLGKIEVRYKDGRRGTILLRQSDEGPVGNPTIRVWLNINSNWYQTVTLKELRTVAEACAARGTKVEQ